MNKKRFILTFAASMLVLGAFAQLPDVVWSKLYGGNKKDLPASVVPTQDGGFIVAGTTISDAGSAPASDVHERRGTTTAELNAEDFWILKLDAEGLIEWRKIYGGTAKDIPTRVRQTPDGGYVVTGRTLSGNGDVFAHNGGGDIWVLRLKADGSLDWENTYETSMGEYGQDIIEAGDGGYLLVGSREYEPSAAQSLSKPKWPLLIRIDDEGAVLWEKFYNTPDSGDVRGTVMEAVRTDDGGYVLGIWYDSDIASTNLTKTHKGDLGIMKVNAAGELEWRKRLEGNMMDHLSALMQMDDGGFLLAGHTHSQTADFDKAQDNDMSDLVFVKIDAAGQNLVWSRSYGGALRDSIARMAGTNDGGFIVSAISTSSDADHGAPNKGGADAWILKLDRDGALEWESGFGGSGDDMVFSIATLSDGRFVIAGSTTSADGDLAGMTGRGAEDYWITLFAAPGPDSLAVAVSGGLPASVEGIGSTLQLEAAMYPRVLRQEFAWTIVAGTGDAVIDADGLMTAVAEGTVWARASWIQDASFADSVEIIITVEEDPGEPGNIYEVHAGYTRLNLFPNPARDRMILHSDNPHPAMNLSVVDISGKILWMQSVTESRLTDEFSIDVSALPSGFYLLRSEAGGRSSSYGFNIQK